jgi:hypothetical protein
VTHASRSAGFTHKPPTGRFVADKSSVDDGVPQTGQARLLFVFTTFASWGY